jgi:hypothetical protein
MNVKLCIAAVVALAAAPLIRAQSWTDFRATIRDAVDYPGGEFAPGVYPGSHHILFTRDVTFGRRIHSPEELEDALDPFRLDPYTVYIMIGCKGADRRTVSLQTTASNQTMQLTATVPEVESPFED